MVQEILNAYQIVNVDGEIVKEVMCASIADAEAMRMDLVCNGNQAMMGGSVRPLSSKIRNKRSNAKLLSKYSIVYKSVKMHVDDEKDIKEYAKLTRQARGLK